MTDGASAADPIHPSGATSDRRYSVDAKLRPGEVAAWGGVLEARGWKRTAEEDWQLFLTHGRPSDEFYRRLGAGQWVNRFPGMGAYAIKSFLNDNLRQAADAYEARTGDRSKGRFHPPTFSVPRDIEAWLAAREDHPDWFWLLKPSASSRGRGISFVVDPGDLPTVGDWVVQRYIERPHLIDGFKYGLRYYVLLTSLDPLLCYVHRQGTCRLATRPFSLDSESLRDPVVHLINTAVQQTQSETPWWSRNLTLGEYYDRLGGEGVDLDRLDRRIRDLLVRTLIACREQALIESRASTQRVKGCFEFLGVDIQIDEELNPWLLECNPAPPMEDEGGFDAASGARFGAVKEALMVDTISLLPFANPNEESLLGSRESYWIARSDRELAEKGGYQRLWPGPDADRFLEDLPLLRPVERRLVGRVSPRIAGSSQAPAPSPSVTAIPLGEGLALHQEGSGRLYATNASAAFVWCGLVDGLSLDEIIEEMLEVSPTTEPDITQDRVWDLVIAWGQSGLLAGFEPRASTLIARPSIDVLVDPNWTETLLVVPEGVSGSTRVSVPSLGVRRIVLVHFGKADSSRRATAAAALDTMGRCCPGGLRVPSADVVPLVEWVNACDIHEVVVGPRSEKILSEAVTGILGLQS